MTRPNMIRADTLDLQDHDQPSAQVHPHTRPYANGSAPLGPHQTAELRHVHEERNAEQEHLADQFGSGRSSHEGSELLEEDPEFLLDNGPDPHDPRHDEAALQQNGGLQVASAEDEADLMDDRDDGLDDDDDDDDVDKMSSSPSIGDEDIDFEFVYALHTFVATVEGQANATKGDTMVLLDDSNSYWWLVRVVKDSSIGYLPAEHIETPTERLARLNKHRNIDLAQTMLGDTPERSKNPLKKAMRRRNAKMVQFAPPTYFEAAETEWSDEEGEGDEPMMEGVSEDGQSVQEADRASADTNGVTEPQQHPHQQTRQDDDQITPVEATDHVSTEAMAVAAQAKSEVGRKSEESMDDETRSNRSRNGTIRNTDSFFKDDKAEPRKISLTPNLLRDDASGKSNESPDKASMETFFNELDKTSSNEKPKDAKASKKDKKADKDKKSSVLSGLFKRKDKKIKVDEAAGGTVSKQPEIDIPVSPSTATMASTDASSAPSPTSPSYPAPLQTKGVKGGKLTKAPPQTPTPQPQQTLPPQSSPAAAPSPNDTTPSTIQSGKPPPLALQIPEDDAAKDKARILSPLTSLMSTSSNEQPIKKEKLKKAKTRMELDVDSSPENELADDYDPVTRQLRKPGYPTPVRTSPHAPFGTRDPMPQGQKSSGRQFEESSQSTGTYGDSFEIQERSTAATTPADLDHASWDAAALRSYLESHSTADIKEMMLLISDPAHVVQVHDSHPLIAELGFKEHQKKLDDLSGQLDGLLNGFLTKRRILPRVEPAR